MEDQKHTPLPWEQESVEGESIRTHCIKIDAGADANDGIILARFYGPDREANAQLFMEAPVMKTEIERLTTALEEAYNGLMVFELRKEIEELKSKKEELIRELLDVADLRII